jgi:hypothetical protein
MKSKLRSFVCLAASFAGIFSISASAAIPLGENSRVQIGGFISQGYIKSDGNNYPFQDNQGTFDFREMAFNASTTFGSHLRVGGQLFAQRLGNYGDDKVKLDWANADYNFRQEIGVRVGRIKYPKGLYGEALDLDVVRPFIFLPMSIYNPIMRDFSASFDGAMVYGTFGLGAKGGSLDYKLFYGDIKMDKDQGVADFFNDSDLYAGGVQKLGLDSVRGVALDWSTPVSGLKVHASYSELTDLFGDGQFYAMPVLPVSIQLPSIGYTTFGAEYVHGDWTFAAEYQIQDGNTKIVAAPVLNQTGNYGMNNWYVSAARRFASKWEVGGYYSFSEDRYPSATAKKEAKQIGDWALSLRYDLNEHVTFKAEYHYVDGNYNMFNTAKTPNPTLDEQTQLFALKTTLSF